MEPIHQWLYDFYARPRLKRLPAFQQGEIRRLLDGAAEMDRLDREDALNDLQLEWCTAAFAVGVRLGMELWSQLPAFTAPDRSSGPSHLPG